MIRKLFEYLAWMWHEWGKDDTNMFRNGLEAAGGAIILFAFPACSIITIGWQAFHNQSPTFLSFSYPLLTIALSDIYDAFGRIGENHMKNKKVWFRIILSAISFALALWLSFAGKMSLWHVLPLVPLFMNGVLLGRDMLFRWKISIDLMYAEMKGAMSDEENTAPAETGVADS